MANDAMEQERNSVTGFLFFVTTVCTLSLRQSDNE